MIANFEEYGFEVRAEIIPDTCTACPFWGYLMRENKGACGITGREEEAGDEPDDRRMSDCPIKKRQSKESEIVTCEECDNCRKVDEHEMWCEGRGSVSVLVAKGEFCSRGRKSISH